MNNPTLQKITVFLGDNLFYYIIVPLTGYLIYYAIATLEWRMFHDSSIMMYIAFLIGELGYVPYRDIFDMNLPGSYLIYVIIGHLSGYSDIGFRIADLIFLGIISLGSVLILRKVSWRAAWAAPVIFGILYLGGGPKMSLEREYVMLPFIIFAVVSAVSFDRLPYNLRSFLIGFFFGMAALIKPTVLIGFPAVLIYNLITANKAVSRNPYFYATSVGIALAGIALPIAAALVYLWRSGVLPDFIDIVTGYWPLYGELSGFYRILTGLSILKFMLLTLRSFGDYGIWAVVGVISVIWYFAFAKTEKKMGSLVTLLVILSVSYYIYPIFTGQFYFYHWIPFLYLISLLCSISAVKFVAGERIPKGLLPISVFILAMIISIKLPSGGFRNIYGDHELEEPWGGRADEIAEVIRSRTGPGDAVQPLDWNSGAAQGLLLARAELATRFVYDFHFYHGTSSIYIMKLRDEFITELENAPPRLIVKIVDELEPRFFTPGTDEDFFELSDLISTEYIPIAEGDGYIIYERRDEAR